MILKRIRVVVSFTVFVSFLFAFLGSGSLALSVAKIVPAVQFIPSFINFFFSGAVLSAAGFIMVLVSAILFGRVYCAAFCPLGILQDSMIYLKRKFKKKKKSSYYKINGIVRYGFLFMVILSMAAGTLLLVNLFDPYSLFGRIVADLFKPAAGLTANTAAGFLERFDIYIIERIDMHKVISSIFITVAAMSILLTVAVIWKDRVYCNSICPVGAVLGFLSRVSLFKIEIDREDCSGCGLCGTACRAGCIDSSSGRVDNSRCVRCFDCLDSCPSNALAFSYGKRSEKETGHSGDISRRVFIKKSMIGMAALFLRAITGPVRMYGSSPVSDAGVLNVPVMPPGAGSIKEFTAKCTGCNLCVSRCPTHVIRPSLLEYGLSGIMQPVLDYNTAYCEYECNICSQVCPSNALKPLELSDKKRLQIGRAELFQALCICYAKGQDCGACAEHCPTKAVHMVRCGDIYAPVTDVSVCIGCGACENVCPVIPYRAIRVTGNSIQSEAARPIRRQRQKRKGSRGKGFPF